MSRPIVSADVEHKEESAGRPTSQPKASRTSAATTMPAWQLTIIDALSALPVHRKRIEDWPAFADDKTLATTEIGKLDQAAIDLINTINERVSKYIGYYPADYRQSAQLKAAKKSLDEKKAHMREMSISELSQYIPFTTEF